MKSLTAAKRAAANSLAASARRDDLIRKAHTEGSTIRAIAAATGLSSARIHQIIHHR